MPQPADNKQCFTSEDLKKIQYYLDEVLVPSEISNVKKFSLGVLLQVSVPVAAREDEKDMKEVEVHLLYLNCESALV
ncbi:hypothetical protein KOW79_007703 [Hemibagrus wyckioides]|uniref:Uncharacterized protein n=1 Tax=Hemibagrus wyckioides TaxID=337641 RepID=A0A9D3NVU4_9TELE|nr:hypothetical protein KOW79_007703 [Hemibagrus wyckioides]